MIPLAGSGLNAEGNISIFEIVAALFVIMPVYNLYVKMFVLETNKLKMHTTGGANIKKSTPTLLFIVPNSCTLCPTFNEEFWFN